MYPLLVATRELHAFRTAHHFRTAHMMGRAEGMQLKHRSSVRVHGGRRSAAIPWIAVVAISLLAPHAPQVHATSRVALLRKAQSVPTKRACAPMLQRVRLR